jgi:hypothetical protein
MLDTIFSKVSKNICRYCEGERDIFGHIAGFY